MRKNAVLISCLVTSALSALAPGAHWSLSDQDYSTLSWNPENSMPAPDKSQVDAWITNCQMQPSPPTLEERVNVLEGRVSTVEAVQKSLPSIVTP